MNKQTIDYVFKAKSDNSLEFIGDFESLYKNEEDPWDQSGKGATGNYYKISRDRLNEKLTELKFNSLTEIGCGLGYTTNYIKKSLPDLSNLFFNQISSVTNGINGCNKIRICLNI